MKTAYDILGDIIADLSCRKVELSQCRREIADAWEKYSEDRVDEALEVAAKIIEARKGISESHSDIALMVRNLKSAALALGEDA